MNRNKSSFRIPIALHIYSSLILTALITVSMISVSNTIILKSYITSECNNRITSAVKSCEKFAEASRPDSDIFSSDEVSSVEDRLKEVISRSDVTNEATVVLFKRDDASLTGYSLLWPSYSGSYAYQMADGVFNAALVDNPDPTKLISDASTKTVIYEDSEIYYRFVGVNVENEDGESSDDTYYILIYVNSRAYYSFSKAMQLALLRSIIIAIICSAVLSIIVASPIYLSTRKLSRFAGRIGKGDFAPIKGHIVSRELADLAGVMNRMANKLQQSDIEQKTFFQNASHELRTPLMSIQGYAEGIKYDIFDEKGKKEAVDVIISETTRLSTLVENLLSISKMDMSRSGTYEVKKQMLEVREITESVIDKVRGGFLHEGKNLVNDFDIDNVYIFANENDIFRMLENIFSNGLRYAESSVTFKCSYDTSHVTFRISDDGPGISEEVQKHLFERFAKGQDGKHGIGMALAKSIAEEHGGTIKAYNAPEGGAVFEIRIPTAKCREQLSRLNNTSEEE